ncbi:hypothetical protein EJ03DRAFT_380292 [Teratosphaeria nubilosa]|uniref:40S ribosomal protein S3 n=1 Tax=Teratosphaeria nubilosa TaxID=161662 RepID=A0A6G1LKT9_9PEZI|nr:hypothetical protein EJ03DRAFT_380292 [Teratosphaeria nubilosa]
MSAYKYDESKIPKKLKDWIDGSHQFIVTNSSRIIFLNDPGFSQEDLKHGLIYARNRMLDSLKKFADNAKLACERYRYRINVDYFLTKWDDPADHFPGTMLKDVQWYGGRGERLIFDTDWRGGKVEHGILKEPAEFRKTLAAFCRFRVRMETDNYYLRDAIEAEIVDDGPASVDFNKALNSHISTAKMQKTEAPAQALSGTNISKRRKFVADGVFYAELNEFFQRELAEEGYSGVEVRVTPTVTDIIIRATHTQEVLGEQGRRIRELTSLITHRFRFPPDSVSLYAAKVQSRGLSAVAQCESLRYKLLNGLAVRRACYGVLRFIMESGAKGCEVVVSGKLRAARAKSMKFTDGFMIHSGQPAKDFIDSATRHVLLRQGVLGIKVKIMRASSSPSDPSGEKAGGKGLPDSVTIIEPKEEQPILQPNSQDYGAKAAAAQAAAQQAQQQEAPEALLVAVMEKEGLPRYSSVDEYASLRARRRFHKRIAKFATLATVGLICISQWTKSNTNARQSNGLLSVERLQADYATCSKLRSVPHDPSGPRERNARYMDGHKPVLIRNATVWTGEPVTGTSPEDARIGKGYEWVQADVLTEHGLIKQVQSNIDLSTLSSETEIWNAHGRLLTTGIVDMHSHAGVNTLPNLQGSSDDNELSNNITPYVRSIDGFNPLDPHLQVIKSGGVTTSLILPGSGNNIGGEAYVLKHAVGKANGRPEISAEDMLADPEKNWRYIKMACGENPKRVYGKEGRDFGPFSRLGEAWYFRHAFEQARALVDSQNDWCAAADRSGVENMQSYLPADLQWETLGAVLRGQVHVNTHCYTVPDLEAFVRHSNEFRFPVRAFHHAHQTYLVPEILNRTYGGRAPAAALFADNMYYKAEAYIASEQAGKVLWDNGITPVYVSDNPVINAQHVVFEAAKAYKNGLPYHVALAGVTSASAELLGLGERIGKVKEGFDADLVVWDSDPLSVGATPVQVWIDGTAQFEDPVELKKPDAGPLVPQTDLQDIKSQISEMKDVVFTGITKTLLPGHDIELSGKDNRVVIRDGTIACIGLCAAEASTAAFDGVKSVQLRDGHIAPALTAFGSFLGLQEISAESDTNDGDNGENSFSSAIDGLALGGKALHAAYSHGVTKAISAPPYSGGGHKGISVGFHTGARFVGEKDTVFASQVALHYTLNLGAKGGKTPSISSAIGDLREKLLKAVHANVTDDAAPEEKALVRVVQDHFPLVLDADSADTISHILRLKTEIEAESQKPLRLIIFGGAESYLLAPSLSASNVSVVLAPLQPYAVSWDQRRSLTGAPITNATAIDILHAAGVRVAISTTEGWDWETRDLALSAGIAYANGGGRISEREALGFVSGNLFAMLGLEEEEGAGEFVVVDGSPLRIEGRVRGVADGRGGLYLKSTFDVHCAVIDWVMGQRAMDGVSETSYSAITGALRHRASVTDDEGKKVNWSNVKAVVCTQPRQLVNCSTGY